MGIRLEPATLRHMWPRAPQAKIDSICNISDEVFAEHGIDDNYVVAQLMGNISHENGAGTIIRESGMYLHADRILEIFGAPHSSAAVTPREAQALVKRPEALFERVYNLPASPKLARMLGNYKPGDGYKFRGAGDLQSTGRGAMARLAQRVGRPELAENPDLLEDHELSFRVAVAEFAALGCIPLALKRNTTAVRRKVNGGTNGLAEVKVWVRRWEEALPDIDEPAKVPRGADTGDRKFADSKILKGSVIGGGATVVEVAAQATQQASDTATTVQSTLDNVHNTVDTTSTVIRSVKPFLGVAPEVWHWIGIAAGVAALAALVYVGWHRWLKHRNEGV